MKQTQQRIKLFSKLIFLTAFCVLIVSLFIYPEYQKNKTAIDQIQGAKTQLSTNQKNLAKLESIQTNKQNIVDDLALFSGAFVSRDKIFDFINTLEKINNDSGTKQRIQILGATENTSKTTPTDSDSDESTSPARPTKKTTTDRDRVQISIEGTFEQLMNYLARLEQGAVVVSPNSFELRLNPDPSERYPYLLQGIFTFLYKD